MRECCRDLAPAPYALYSSLWILLAVSFPSSIYSIRLQKYMNCKGGCAASIGSDQPAEVVKDAPKNMGRLDDIVGSSSMSKA